MSNSSFSQNDGDEAQSYTSLHQNWRSKQNISPKVEDTRQKSREETWTKFPHRFWDIPEAQRLDHSTHRVWDFAVREWGFFHGVWKKNALSLTYEKWRQTYPEVRMCRDTFYKARKRLLKSGLITRCGEPQNGLRDLFALNLKVPSETVLENRPVGNEDRSETKTGTVPEIRPVPYLESDRKDIQDNGNTIPPTPQGGYASGKYFEAFRKIYPKKNTSVTMKKAKIAWDRVVPDEDTARRIVSDLKQRIMSEKWLEEGGRFIPTPAKYLENGEWQKTAVPHKEQGQSPAPNDPFLEACHAVHSEHPEWDKQKVGAYVEETLKISPK